MATGRAKKQRDDPGGLPDGTVRWTAAMRGALAEFRNAPCRQCGATLSDNQPLHEQLDHLGRHRDGFGGSERDGDDHGDVEVVRPVLRWRRCGPGG